MKRPIIILSCCLVFGITVVLGLFAATYRAVHEPSSFLRTYREFAVSKVNELDLGFNSYYIAGITSDKIYLGNITAPFNMLIVDHNLKDTVSVQLRVAGMDSLTFYKSVTVKIDSPYFYIADGIQPGVYRGRVGEWVAEKYYKEREYFTQLIPISRTSFAIRTNHAATKEHVLGKLQIDTPHIKVTTNLLQKQVDGFFCTDGLMNYNRDLRKLVYTYYYRNEFIVYDTNLNLEYRGHTIDTFSRADIKVQHVNSDGTNTLTYKKLINRGTWTSGNHHFVNSNLLARNDRPNMFPMMTIIDVYSLNTGGYEFSFTIANIDTETKVQEFRMYENKILLVLAGNHIMKFELKDGLLDDVNL